VIGLAFNACRANFAIQSQFILAVPQSLVRPEQ
jgi:hypothetical protein